MQINEIFFWVNFYFYKISVRNMAKDGLWPKTGLLLSERKTVFLHSVFYCFTQKFKRVAKNGRE